MHKIKMCNKKPVSVTEMHIPKFTHSTSTSFSVDGVSINPVNQGMTPNIVESSLALLQPPYLQQTSPSSHSFLGPHLQVSKVYNWHERQSSKVSKSWWF